MAKCILMGLVFGGVTGALIETGTGNHYISLGVGMAVLAISFYAAMVIEAIQTNK